MKALIGLGTPVSPVDDRSYDLNFLRTCEKPKLFVSGSRDQFGPRAKLEELVASLDEPKKLVIIESADHFFEGRLREMREAIETWIKETIQDATIMKEIARHIFDHAMRASSISRAFALHVHCERGILRVCDDLYDLNSYNRTFVIALGKAAHSMLAALHEQTGERFEGIVASPVVPEFQVRGFRYFHGGHPLPNAESIRAAEAMLKSLSVQNEASLVIYLISGGGSATVEKPIDDEISMDDLVETYRVLVHSGASIREINAIRKHLSAVKGGRLAQAAYPARQVSILISDVPDATPDALASGPTMPDSTTVADCFAIASQYKLLEQFPKSVRELFERHALDETPKSDDPGFHSRALVDDPFELRAAGNRREGSKAARISGLRSTTLATIGTTRELPIISCISCGSCAHS